MTVRELRDILDSYSDDYEVFGADSEGNWYKEIYIESVIYIDSEDPDEPDPVPALALHAEGEVDVYHKEDDDEW